MTFPLFLIDPSKDETPVNGDELHDGWVLTVPENVARHAFRSMRLDVGDRLWLSDGRGLRILATVHDPANRQVRVEEVGREPAAVTRLQLVQALAKSGRDEQAIETATEIGVDSVVPWQANRSIVQWKGAKEAKAANKWRQLLDAATEQSRRAWTPLLQPKATSRSIVEMCLRAGVHGDMVIVLHQDATDTWDSIERKVSSIADRCLEDGRERTISVVVGPEGGISEEEVASFVKAGASAVVLGSNIMRASSAGPVALALLARVLGRFE
ncbi:16S rRNA (uracil(1498)-N(3))-methyltransferase [Bifidobacterium primatium]|uniref:Ribosomal RNA small subunit methyltransferase E n=1 Tax=Bifidobacterium primatium TaxID=2045438 RepID=A0A2M9H865_9BIFI|nr:16S rRNA (uracil(1498)-N(3))-methyltransferase [Bifidobacterium primatium]PJM73002.1 16S rRNA (uracil(1498)-N(3))-methyltransferase [Bifidobacterium primatium]